MEVRENNGGTALMAASVKGHQEIVKLLLANGADVNAKANTGDTVLSLVSKFGDKEVKEIKELLISAGAK